MNLKEKNVADFLLIYVLWPGSLKYFHVKINDFIFPRTNENIVKKQ